MAKRFTDTEKWNDKWFRSLKPLEKLIFNFLCDRCDIAGFYEIDLEDMEFRIGMNDKEILGAIQGLNRGYLTLSEEIKNGDFIWIKNFLEHQKNLPLNPENNAHKAIFNSLFKHSEFKEKIGEYLGADQGLISPIGKGKGKGKGKEGESEGEENFFYDDYFESFFDEYHKITGLRKTDKEAAYKKWKRLKHEEKIKAMDMIRKYYDSVENKKYLKKARTYLEDKNFDDEFSVVAIPKLTRLGNGQD